MPRPPTLDTEDVSPTERAQYTPLLPSGGGLTPGQMVLRRAATSVRLGDGRSLSENKVRMDFESHRYSPRHQEVADLADHMEHLPLQSHHRDPKRHKTEWRNEDKKDTLSWCRRRGSSMIILPEETGCWLSAWDLFMGATALYVAFYEPYCLTLMDKDKDRIVNTLLDSLLLMDVVLQFFVAYPYATESNASNLWETDPLMVAKRYMNVPFSYGMTGGWFWLDMLSVLPSFACRNGSNPLSILRLLRLLRMMRLARLKKLMDEWHKIYGYSYNMVEVLKFMMVTTLTVHWMACLWIAVEGKITKGPISYRTKPDEESWLSIMISSKGDTCYPDVYSDSPCVYLIALYWASMTVTGVGYGDVTPQNKMEYAACVFCMLSSGYVWAYVVGSIVSILASLDPQEVRFRQHTDELSGLMRNRELTGDLQRRLRGYMHAARRVSRLRGQRQLLKENISCGLQREVAASSGVIQCLISKIFWAADLEPEALYDIVRALWPCYFGPQETMAMRQMLVIIRRGIAVYKGRFMSRDDVWGAEDILLDSDHLLEEGMPKTLSYVEILQLTKKDLIHVCSNFHQADKRIRRAQIRVAVRRGVVDAARRMKVAQMDGKAAARLQQPRAQFSARRDDVLRMSRVEPNHENHNLSGMVRELTIRQDALLSEVQRISSVMDVSVSSSTSPVFRKQSSEFDVSQTWSLTGNHIGEEKRQQQDEGWATRFRLPSEVNGSRRVSKDSRTTVRSSRTNESPKNRRGSGKDVL